MSDNTYRRREIVTIRGGQENKYTPDCSLQNVLGFKIIKVMANNNFHNVITGQNDTFDWLDSGATIRTATIPAGKYDYLSFATAFDLAVNAVSSLDTFTTTYDLNTGKYNIATNNSIIPKWLNGLNSNKNVSFIMGYFNNTIGNETASTNHTSNFPAQLIPPFYLFKSSVLGSSRKSSGGGGGTQIYTQNLYGGVIDSAPQNYITSLPNQSNGNISTYIYQASDDNCETYEYNAPRQMSNIDFSIVHPYYPHIGQNGFISVYNTITYEIEFICQKRFK